MSLLERCSFISSLYSETILFITCRSQRGVILQTKVFLMLQNSLKTAI